MIKMRKDKLHTVNRFNRIAFMPEEEANLFAFAGPLNTSIDFNKLNALKQDVVAQQNHNWFGISKAKNPFSKMNIGNTMKGFAPAAGQAIGGFGKNLLSNGFSTGVGEGISSIGSTIGGAIGTVNPVLGGIVSAASGLVGGLWNGAFGVKYNEDVINGIKDNAASMESAGNALAQANTNAEVMDAARGMGSTMNIDYHDLGSTGFLRSNNALKREQARLNKQQNLALAKQSHGLMTGARQADQTQDDLVMANFAAQGGFLDNLKDNDMDATNYSLAMDYLLTKQKQAEAKDKMTTMNFNYFTEPNEFASGGGIHIKKKNRGKFNATKKRTGKTTEELTHSKNPLTRKRAIFALNSRKWKHDEGGPLNILCGGGRTFFDLGGDIQTHGADYSTGLMEINAGSSHELNPNEGVQLGVDNQGVPNLVEEGETVFNDYVYSDRIEMDDKAKERFHISKRKGYTYAEFSKKLNKEASERPNDPISQASLKAQMADLAEEQERQKAEMEAERAREAFEALSPEEQTAVMQQVAAQEQQAQEAAMQQQAMAEQQAMQQPSPGEAVMMQQQMAIPQDQMMQESETSQQPVLQAEGGQLYAGGGELRKKILGLLGIHTENEFRKWAKDNGVTSPSDFGNDSQWEKLLTETTFRKAIAKGNPALAHALENSYDLGLYKPSGLVKATIQSISKGNWKATNGKGWRNSEDLAFKQATEGLTPEQIDALTTEQLAERMRNTDAYKNTSKWLENSDNALLYLNTLLNDPNTPDVAKDYARRFVKDGRWKDGFNYDYTTVFGSNGKGVRETDPGTYWHSVMEANRGNNIANYIINDDGSIEEIFTDIPTDWTLTNNYSWATPENDITYNYYKRPVVKAAEDAAATAVDKEKPAVAVDVNGRLKPILLPETNFGMYAPLVNLGMMAAKIGSPDYSGLDRAQAIANRGAALASYQPIGDYVRYSPFDIWSAQNRLDAENRGTQRGMLNQSLPGRYAGLVALAHEENKGAGQLQRQGAESNLSQKLQDAEFNRATNIQNANAFNALSQFNAQQRNADRQFRSQMAMQDALHRMEADASWYNSLYGNIGKMADNIAARERETRDRNWTAKMLASGIVPGVNPNSPLFEGYVEKASSAEGGSIRRKKNKRRGLTI